VFRINEVIKFHDERFRILESLDEQLVWISLDDEKALPELILTGEIYKAIDDVNGSLNLTPFGVNSAI